MSGHNWIILLNMMQIFKWSSIQLFCLFFDCYNNYTDWQDWTGISVSMFCWCEDFYCDGIKSLVGWFPILKWDGWKEKWLAWATNTIHLRSLSHAHPHTRAQTDTHTCRDTYTHTVINPEQRYKSIFHRQICWVCNNAAWVWGLPITG